MKIGIIALKSVLLENYCSQVSLFLTQNDSSRHLNALAAGATKPALMDLAGKTSSYV